MLGFGVLGAEVLGIGPLHQITALVTTTLVSIRNVLGFTGNTPVASSTKAQARAAGQPVGVTPLAAATTTAATVKPNGVFSKFFHAETLISAISAAAPIFKMALGVRTLAEAATKAGAYGIVGLAAKTLTAGRARQQSSMIYAFAAQTLAAVRSSTYIAAAQVRALVGAIRVNIAAMAGNTVTISGFNASTSITHSANADVDVDAPLNVNTATAVSASTPVTVPMALGVNVLAQAATHAGAIGVTALRGATRTASAARSKLYGIVGIAAQTATLARAKSTLTNLIVIAAAAQVAISSMASTVNKLTLRAQTAVTNTASGALTLPLSLAANGLTTVAQGIYRFGFLKASSLIGAMARPAISGAVRMTTATASSVRTHSNFSPIYHMMATLSSAVSARAVSITRLAMKVRAATDISGGAHAAGIVGIVAHGMSRAAAALKSAPVVPFAGRTRTAASMLAPPRGAIGFASKATATVRAKTAVGFLAALAGRTRSTFAAVAAPAWKLALHGLPLLAARAHPNPNFPAFMHGRVTGMTASHAALSGKAAMRSLANAASRGALSAPSMVMELFGRARLATTTIGRATGRIAFAARSTTAAVTRPGVIYKAILVARTLAHAASGLGMSQSPLMLGAKATISAVASFGRKVIAAAIGIPVNGVLGTTILGGGGAINVTGQGGSDNEQGQL